MPTIDWNEVPQEGEYMPLPDGEYEVQIVDVKVRSGGPGKAESWGLQLEVTDGQYRGRQIWDNLTWGPIHTDNGKKALQRCRLVLSHCGVPVEGVTNYDPGVLVGKCCVVEVYTDEYQGRKQNRIPFAGWKKPERSSLESEPAPF